MSQVLVPAIAYDSMPIQEMAKMIALSSVIPSSLQKKPADIFVILLIARELGIPQMSAINGVNVIQGKLSVSPQLMLALIRRRMPNCFIKIETCDDPVKCIVTMARDKDKMDEAYTTIWDMERARKLQLDQKDNYKKQPLTMLQWRAVGDASRKIFSDVLNGLYFPDELNDGSIFINEEGEVEKERVVRNIKPVPAIPTTYELIRKCLEITTDNFENKIILNELSEKFNFKSKEDILAKPIEEQESMLGELQIIIETNKAS